MGAQDHAIPRLVTTTKTQPEGDEFEIALIGPGYGESVVIHIGKGVWIIVDSCLDADRKTPSALKYLEGIGLDPAQVVELVVATHWHDDHIRGIAEIVRRCPSATFCCASVLLQREFLVRVGALETRSFSAAGSGLRELHDVFSTLSDAKKVPIHAIANRTVFKQGNCTVSSLSPGDGVFQKFLMLIADQVSHSGEPKRRAGRLSPNDVAVALWIDAVEFSVILGADLERSGWSAILAGGVRPAGKASAFKIPHHGSKDADEPGVWSQMLEPDPVAILTPWHKGGHHLPEEADVNRILATTPHAYASSTPNTTQSSTPRHKNKMVARTLRESSVRTRPLSAQHGMVRLRRRVAPQTPWTVDVFGDACHL